MQSFPLDEFIERYGIDEDHPTLLLYEHLRATAPTRGATLAGGAVRALVQGLPVTTDYDLFFSDIDAFNRTAEYFDGRAELIIETDHHRTYMYDGKKVQLIKIAFYTNTEALLDSFDYTICQLALRDGALHLGNYTLYDIGRKRLCVHKITYGVASMRRLLKYASQGFTACSGTYKALLDAAITNPDVVRSDVQYVD